MAFIPARQSVAVSVRQGQLIKIINTHGNQVVDFWAFDPNEWHNRLSVAHTRIKLLRLSIRPGDSLYSTKSKPILKLVEDTSPGVHDLLWPACDAERYRMAGVVGYHDSCSDNLHRALGNGFPNIGLPKEYTPEPLNLFMNVVMENNGLIINPPVSERGQHVVMKAEKDLVIVMSACPSDVAPTNGGNPTDCEYLVYEDSSTA